MPAFLAPLIGVAARAAAPAIARAAAPMARAAMGRAATFAAGRGGVAGMARGAVGAVAKSPLKAGLVGFAAGKALGGGQSSSRQENFDNWFPGQGNNGAMY